MTAFTIDRTTSPAEILAQIREIFDDLNLPANTLTVEHEDQCYRISCDETSFMVYRVNCAGKNRHHLPGWPVCLVTEESVYEEHCAPGLGDDHCASGCDVESWLSILKAFAERASGQ